MASKKELSLDLGAGGSSVPTAGGEEFSLMSCTAKSMGFSLQPCTQAKSRGFSLQPCGKAAEEALAGEESAPKRKALTAGLGGCAPKRRGEEEDEARRAVDSDLTVLEGEEGDDLDFYEPDEVIEARYAANMQRLFGNNPNVVWVDFPDCCVRPPGVEFPKPCDRRCDDRTDAAKGEEEVGGAVTPPLSA